MKNTIFAVLLLGLFSCSQDESISKELASLEYRVGRNYDEMACIVDNKAGIKCFESVGKTCKKEHSCKPVEAIGADQFFTQAEFNDWMNVNFDANAAFKYYMWEIGWFIHPFEDQ